MVLLFASVVFRCVANDEAGVWGAGFLLTFVETEAVFWGTKSGDAVEVARAWAFMFGPVVFGGAAK